MHTHDRTLTASLGFADPDKQNALHDLACAYLATPEVMRTIFDQGPKWADFDCKQEAPLLKGEGKYQVTVGFIDALMTDYERVIAVEVKIGRVPVGDIIRQITLYRSHVGPEFHIDRVDEWIVALRYDIDETYAEALESAEIRPLKLGDGFTRWLGTRKKGTARIPQI